VSSPTSSILVVDDIEANRDLLARRLRRRGYNAVVAVDGPAALLALRTHVFHVVLLDVRMPGMSGIEVLEEIRKTHSKTSLPVLMVSAQTDSADVVLALTRGANDYITKPVDYPVALARIEAQLAVREEVEKVRQPTVVASTTDFEKGFILDERYQIEAFLGSGGFAVVYRATQLSSGQSVALKILRADRVLQDKQGSVELARFEQEMRLIGRIKHPHIVKLVDSGRLRVELGMRAPMESSKVEVSVAAPAATAVSRRRSPSDTEQLTVIETAIPYLVMEYLEGETLGDLLAREAPLNVPWAVDLVLPLLSALGVAHAENVVHRDLKPQNIFLTGSPRGVQPHLLDFGIAKLVGDTVSSLTQTASVLGTPDYMPPEQAEGAKDISAAADQYSMGAVLYECLTSSPPYVADTFMQVLKMVVNGDFKRPATLNEAIPAELDEIIVRSMAKAPSDRFDSARSFGRALLPFASEAGRTNWSATFEDVLEF
jgi:DNA-binding response OmpR family regulator